MGNRAGDIEAARVKFNSYESEWEKAYFDEYRGGYLVVSKKRIEQGNLNKQEKEKYNKEYSMCLTLAQNGNQIEYLKMTEGSFDIYLNGISADLKKTSSHNNLLDYAKKATREQGAEIVVFEFEKETENIHNEIITLKNKKIHGLYYFSKNKKVIHNF
ncbi:MAG: hypothetical protein FWD56_08060 [Bacteroidales bacterium]|nr:hypothetical protein [Bacteroidales bacterium]